MRRALLVALLALLAGGCLGSQNCYEAYRTADPTRSRVEAFTWCWLPPRR